MQTFVQKQTPALQGPGGHLQMKTSRHGHEAASAARSAPTQLATAQLATGPLKEVERTLNSSTQTNTVAGYQDLFDRSPRVSSVNSHQSMADNSSRVVAQAKFQETLNHRQNVPQVAQLKSDSSISGAVVQRTNGDDKGGSDWAKKLFFGGLGAYFAGTRAMAKHSADPVKRFGAEQTAGLFGAGDYIKGLNMLKYGQHVLKGGYPRYLAAAPLAFGTAYLGSKYLFGSSSKKEEEQ